MQCTNRPCRHPSAISQSVEASARIMSTITIIPQMKAITWKGEDRDYKSLQLEIFSRILHQPVLFDWPPFRFEVSSQCKWDAKINLHSHGHWGSDCLSLVEVSPGPTQWLTTLTVVVLMNGGESPIFLKHHTNNESLPTGHFSLSPLLSRPAFVLSLLHFHACVEGGKRDWLQFGDWD